jgi:hypothetical protein
MKSCDSVNILDQMWTSVNIKDATYFLILDLDLKGSILPGRHQLKRSQVNVFSYIPGEIWKSCLALFLSEV